jgi:glycosyltransferase involved in cell wall biosynthesis
MLDSDIEISVVVPIYNSADIIPILVDRIEHTIKQLGLSFEILLSEDCSADNSWSVIQELSVHNKAIKGIRLSKNCGQWVSTLAGISKARGKYIVTIDDDMEYEPSYIAMLYNTIKDNKYQVVFGIPTDKYILQGKNNFLSKTRKKLMHVLWNSPVTDSFRIIKREVVLTENNILIPNVFIDAYLVNNIDRRFIGYVETRSNPRYAGVSNVNFFKKMKLFLLYRSHFKVSNEFAVFLTAAQSIVLVAFLKFMFYKNFSYLFSIAFFLIMWGFLYIEAFMKLHWKDSKHILFLVVDEVNISS